jgi:transcriptional regulator with GAF, ATPase, and Fis domain
VLSIACMPLLLRGEVQGVLYLDHRFAPDAFTETDLPVLMAFADQALLVLEAARRASAPVAIEAPEWGSDSDHAARDDAQALPPAEQVPRFGRLVGGAPPMRAVAAEIARCARSSAPVLIMGESGTGKELVARELHGRGLTPEAPFLSENCGAIAETLLESELFGYKKGAFTGADRDRRGLFVEAGEGTLFLDEVADTSPGMQAKLLRVLQERRLRPVGGDDTEEIRCRVIVACNQDLKELVRAGRFREDLYYRLDVLRIVLPPLRQRRGDIPALLRDAFVRAGRPRMEVSPEALRALVAWRWPGNVRELENEVRRMLSRATGARVELADLSPELRGTPSGRVESFQGKTMAQVEKEMVVAALKRAGGNKSQAARELGSRAGPSTSSSSATG